MIMTTIKNIHSETSAVLVITCDINEYMDPHFTGLDILPSYLTGFESYEVESGYCHDLAVDEFMDGCMSEEHAMRLSDWGDDCIKTTGGGYLKFEFMRNGNSENGVFWELRIPLIKMHDDCILDDLVYRIKTFKKFMTDIMNDVQSGCSTAKFPYKPDTFEVRSVKQYEEVTTTVVTVSTKINNGSLVMVE